MLEPYCVPATIPLPAAPFAGRADSLARLLVAAKIVREQVQQHLVQHELGDQEFLVLWRCGDSSGGVAQAGLAQDLAISPAQVSGLVEGLRQRGILESHRPAEDRRRQVWRVTATGRSLLTAVVADFAEGFSELPLLEVSLVELLGAWEHVACGDVPPTMTRGAA